ncbi:LysR family transcriptional regulator [Breznakiella homolactica]|uniref:LysR family transcriptional regulator n=1 Tax=Breznakiella homolactica TaxID=2798577 RepID=A0A7T7XJR4_9SPIR|nr:LysR family transcriptional regulator [Breznakiella homolactica]QQO07694.1 LysR family transcriptional regulator [Breznakiella homolactica]
MYCVSGESITCGIEYGHIPILTKVVYQGFRQRRSLFLEDSGVSCYSVIPMDVRILKYFLAVAKEGNITKAADILHVTQPTLSRQLMDLEQELGTELLVRGKRSVTLTPSGVLFQQRALEMVSLLDKAKRDIAGHNGMVAGTVSIGCVETVASLLLPDVLESFHAQYPAVQYEIYTANGDGIRGRIDSGRINIGILVEPVETAKYDFIPLPFQDTWGVIMRADDPLAKKKSLRVGDILGLPLFVPWRDIVIDEIASWIGGDAKKLNILGYNNLMTNTLPLIERGLGYGVCVGGALSIRPYKNICFVPFSPKRTSGHVLAWKKNRIFNQTESLFLEHIKGNFQK